MDSPHATPHEEAALAAGDIARLAGVGKAAVSNWRRRFPDFPAPIGGTSASPLYSLAQVEAWLTEHGKTFTVSTGERIWPRVRATTDDLRLGELIGCLGAFLVFQQRDPHAWDELRTRSAPMAGDALPVAITAAVPELPGALPRPWPPSWLDLADAVCEFAGEVGHVPAFDFLLARYLEAHSRLVSPISDELAELMARLADGASGTVLDPACGLGTGLAAAKAAGATRLLGQESSDTAARLAAVGLLLRAGSAPDDSACAVRIAAGDALRDDAHRGVLADAVICTPPLRERSWGYDDLVGDPRWEYGLPPRGEPELAWVQHCLTHVKPGGHVVIALPAAAASRRPGRRIRGNLLRSGALRAVIGLPAAAHVATPAPVLWVLRRPHEDDATPTHVLVMDCSAAQAALVDEVCPTWHHFGKSDQRREALDPGLAVPIIELLDDEVDLTPARRLAARPDRTAMVAEFVATRDTFLSTIAGMGAMLPTMDTADGPMEAATTTVGELVKAGIVAIHQAPVRTTTDEGNLPALTAKDVRLGRAPSGRTDSQPGMIITEPGDVITPAEARNPAVRVLDAGGAVLGPQLLLFRLDLDRLDPQFFAGYLRSVGAEMVTRAQSAASRTDARRVAIPLLPMVEQRRYGEAFRQLGTFEQALHRTKTLGENVLRLVFAGLVDGTLRPRQQG